MPLKDSLVEWQMAVESITELEDVSTETFRIQTEKKTEREIIISKNRGTAAKGIIYEGW